MLHNAVVRPAGPLARGGFPRTPFGTTLRVGRPTGVTLDEAGDWLSLGTWEILDQLNLSSNEVQRGRSPSHVVSDAHFRIDLGQSGCQKTGHERPMICCWLFLRTNARRGCPVQGDRAKVMLQYPGHARIAVYSLWVN